MCGTGAADCRIQQLGVPLLGVVSDKQASICLAFEEELPALPHQLCQFHYLRDVAQPVCEADRKLKKQLKQKVRGLREVERQVAHKQDDEAQITCGYCLAVREVLRDDGKYPLEPAGIKLYDKLTQIGDSVEKAFNIRTSAKLQRLRTILQAVSVLTKTLRAWSSPGVGFTVWRNCSSERQHARKLKHNCSTLRQSCRVAMTRRLTKAPHIEKLTRAFVPKLFAFHAQP